MSLWGRTVGLCFGIFFANVRIIQGRFSYQVEMLIGGEDQSLNESLLILLRKVAGFATWSNVLRESFFITIGRNFWGLFLCPTFLWLGFKGYLDEQFCQVEDLQDEASPNFVEEVVTLFFKDSAKLMSNIEQALEKYPRDFNRWDAYIQQFKGSCSSCMRSFQKVKREHAVLRQKLESYFQLLRQAGPAGAATRPVM